MKIIITGATGQLGRLVVDQVLKRVPAEQIGVSVRDPKNAQGLADLGVRVRRGDFDDNASLMHAFEGASQVLIVSPNVTGEAAIRQHRNAIEMAKKAGASHIFYTSHMGSSAKSYFPPMISHAAAEEALEASGVPFTSFRNGFYAASAVLMLGEALKTGILSAPEDGPVAWTSHADLAEALAIVLSQGGLKGLTPSLTASEALNLEQIAALASELTGRLIRRVVVPDDSYQAALVARGLPEERVNVMMGLFRASRRGEFSKVDPALAGIIGRQPMSMRDVLKTSIL